MIADIVVYDGLDEMDAVGPLEVLRNRGRRLSATFVSERFVAARRWLLPRCPLPAASRVVRRPAETGVRPRRKGC